MTVPLDRYLICDKGAASLRQNIPRRPDKDRLQTLSSKRCARYGNPDSRFRAIRSQRETKDEYQNLVSEALTLGDGQLREWYHSNMEQVSLDFLFWLSAREQAAVGEEKARLDSLGGKLTALREGIDPIAAERLLASLHEAASALELLGAGTSGDPQVERRQLELSRRRVQEALIPPQLDLSQQHADDFAREMRQRKADSIAEVIGRAPAELKTAELGLNAAAAADRILAALLSIPDKSERLQMLPEAFTQPEQGAQAVEGEDLLFTTPMRLLQAVGLALNRLEKGQVVDTSQVLLEGGKPCSPEELRSSLLELKGAIFECWEVRE